MAAPVSSKQASLASELKSWCLSKLQNMEVRFTGDSSKVQLCSSTTADEGPDEADLTALSPGQTGSSQCLDLHDGPALLDASRAELGLAEGGSANHYFVVHVENSPGELPQKNIIGAGQKNPHRAVFMCCS